jgi:hypothetical protein
VTCIPNITYSVTFLHVVIMSDPSILLPRTLSPHDHCSSLWQSFVAHGSVAPVILPAGSRGFAPRNQLYLPRRSQSTTVKLAYKGISRVVNICPFQTSFCFTCSTVHSICYPITSQIRMLHICRRTHF